MTQAIILAAGKGTRMNSGKVNKCLLPLCGKAMIRYPIEALASLGIDKPIVVVGFAGESIKKELNDQVIYAQQHQQNGTAKAVEAGMDFIDDDTDEVVVLYGDHSAFYDSKVLQQLLNRHHQSQADATLVTVIKKNPYNYGRIIRDDNDRIKAIVEEKNASSQQKEIKEINSGNAVFSNRFLKQILPKIKKNPVSNEYYLTDFVSIGLAEGYKIETFVSKNENLSIGVNTPDQYKEAERLMTEKLGN